MLIALIQNNQNQPGQVVPVSEKLPTVVIDRGGGGPLGPSYDIVDIYAALETFREVPGEHPVARAARRTRHVQDHLWNLRDVRERREGAAFLAGAALAQSAAEEQRAEERAAEDARHAEEIGKLVATIDALRERLAQKPTPDVARRGGGAGAWVLLGAGVAIVLLVARLRSTTRAPA